MVVDALLNLEVPFILNQKFDRVSEMIMRALRWRLCDIEAAKELVKRKKLKENNNEVNILKRDWF